MQNRCKRRLQLHPERNSQTTSSAAFNILSMTKPRLTGNSWLSALGHRTITIGVAPVCIPWRNRVLFLPRKQPANWEKTLFLSPYHKTGVRNVPECSMTNEINLQVGEIKILTQRLIALTLKRSASFFRLTIMLKPPLSPYRTRCIIQAQSPLGVNSWDEEYLTC